MDYCRITMLGRLTQDPEVRATPGGPSISRPVALPKSGPSRFFSGGMRKKTNLRSGRSSSA